jgi:CheY-like chemotaxis protein
MAEPSNSSEEHAPRRVLVADDGRNAAEILAMFFQLEGMETAVAYDGLDAVKLAESFDPHLVCMDLTMPRMDGYEAARIIREWKKDIVLVALSGWDGEDERRRVAEAGFDFHMVKPVSPDELRAMLARSVGHTS